MTADNDRRLVVMMMMVVVLVGVMVQTEEQLNRLNESNFWLNNGRVWTKKEHSRQGIGGNLHNEV